MTAYTYKCVPAPRRPKKSRESRTPAEALAAAVQAVLVEHGAQGWEYVRTDLLPMEHKPGLLSAVQETHQGVMVFRRPLPPAVEDRGEPLARPAPAAPDIPRLGAARID